MSAHKGHCLGLTPKHKDWSEDSKNRQAWNRGKITTDPAKIFMEYSTWSTGGVKQAILKMGLKEYHCSECGIVDWRDKRLSLELDHINGNSRDHRLENLRFLCPNCHSQTPNFRGRGKNTGKQKVTDEALVDALRSEASIRQALLKVGLSAKGGNYVRAKMLKKYAI